MCTMRPVRYPILLLGLFLLTFSLFFQASTVLAKVGKIKEFPIHGDPYYITTGPDGNLWFTLRNMNEIGRITHQGSITEYPIPTAGSEPWGITTGPGKKLWFTESLKGKIGRVSPR